MALLVRWLVGSLDGWLAEAGSSHYCSRTHARTNTTHIRPPIVRAPRLCRDRKPRMTQAVTAVASGGNQTIRQTGACSAGLGMRHRYLPMTMTPVFDDYCNQASASGVQCVVLCASVCYQYECECARVRVGARRCTGRPWDDHSVERQLKSHAVIDP